jgi:hypothetical protein
VESEGGEKFSHKLEDFITISPYSLGIILADVVRARLSSGEHNKEATLCLRKSPCLYRLELTGSLT